MLTLHLKFFSFKFFQVNKQIIGNKLRISIETQDLAISCFGSATEMTRMSLAYSICVKFI